jgi:division protein CdvB (Snf7/Vps24/ESCRT-III family)
MYGQKYHETAAINQLAQCAPVAQTALGEIAQRLSSANVRVADVNARLKDIYSKTFGSTPEPVEKQAQTSQAHSVVSEIQNMFDLLETRILELEGRAVALGKIV